MNARAISPELHEELSEELERLLDEPDDLDSKTKAVRKLLRGERELIDDAIARTRLRLKGVDGHQLEVPGTELGDRRRDPSVTAILEAAARVRDAQGEIEKKHPGARVSVSVGDDGRRTESVTLRPEHRANVDEALRKTIDLDELVGTREAAIAAHEKKTRQKHRRRKDA